MPWYNFWSKDKPTTEQLQETIQDLRSQVQDATNSPPSSLIKSFTQPTTLLSTALLTTVIFSAYAVQRRYLRRIPNAAAIPQSHIIPSTRRFTRSLFGKVTSVGDADNFRLFHTPLGRLALWGLRGVPTDTKALKDKTIHVRLAGVDAPELSHFGRPAQPYSKEALDWLTAYIKGRRVRCYIHKADQYGRVVGTVYIRKGILRRDVGLQMLRAGFATVYEAKGGADFGGPDREKAYKEAEEVAKRKRKGMWAAKDLESPREYKNRFKDGNSG